MQEDAIIAWTKPPSETEDQKSLNAIAQSVEAVQAKFGESVKVVRQGSHWNKTNIRLDSDVDIAIVHTGYFFPGLSLLSDADKALYHQNATTITYSFEQFKNEVEQALRAQFGNIVQRKSKCLRVPGNTTRNSCDVVPAFEHHRFSSYGVVSVNGIHFKTDEGRHITSFPVQHHDNGVTKNDNTGRAYKRMVRILKRARNSLVDKGQLEANSVSSFFIECLVWNVPNPVFDRQSWKEKCEAVTARIWNDMRDEKVAQQYAQVCDLLWLFHEGRTPKQAEIFMQLAHHLLRG